MVRCGGGDDAAAQQPVAEALALRALRGIACEQRIQGGEELRLVDVFAMQGVEPLAAVVGTEHQVVAARRLADQGDLAEVGPRAAVRAAADAQVDRRFVDAVRGEQRFDACHEIGQVAFGLGHRQAAGRQRHAGERVAAQR